MMRAPPGGFLGGGAMFRSMTLSPMQAALQQAHQMARRHLEAGGAAASMQKRRKADLAPKRAKPDLAPRDFVLPLDVDVADVRKAIEGKLRDAALPGLSEAPPILERKAGGRVAVPAHHLLRLGDGRFDLGRRYMHGLIRHIRARRMRRK